MNIVQCIGIKCSKCKEVKEPDAFRDYKRKKNGKESWCKQCHKDNNPKTAKSYRLEKKYGITEEFYNNLLIEQNFECACCGIHVSNIKGPLCVDHNHQLYGPESIRGLVCRSCNSGIGQLGDTLEDVQNAVAYLLRYYGSADNGSN